MKPLRLLQLTDLHFPAEAHQDVHGVYPDQNFDAIYPLVEKWSPDLLVLTGDLADTGDASAYHRLGERLSELPCPKLALPGNHDDKAIMAGILARYAIECPFSVTAGAWRLIMLDSVVPGEPGGHLPGRQLQRLEQALEAQPESHHLVFVHHHPVPVQSPWIDSQSLANGDQLVATLERFPRVAALCWGHIHHQWNEPHPRFRLLGTPATAGQAKPKQDRWVDDDFGPRCRWFQLEPDGQWDTGILEAENQRH